MGALLLETETLSPQHSLLPVIHLGLNASITSSVLSSLPSLPSLPSSFSLGLKLSGFKPVTVDDLSSGTSLLASALNAGSSYLYGVAIILPELGHLDILVNGGLGGLGRGGLDLDGAQT